MAIAFDVTRPLPENAQRDVEAVALNAGKLVGLLRVTSDGRPGFSPAPIFGSIAGQLGVTYQEVSRLFSTVEYISDIGETVGALDKVIGFFEGRLSSERARAFSENKENIRELLTIYNANHPVAIAVKAQRLSRLHQNLFQDGEIITDARPIFDTSGSAVMEMIITHSLIIGYYSSVGSERIHLTMDAVDVQRLRDACDRAMRKAATLKTALGDGRPWPVKVMNERSDDA